MTEADPFQILARITRLLDDLGVPYLVGGSIASSFYGEPRGTRDLDLVIELDADGIESLARALEEFGYVSREAMREAVRDGRSFNAVDPESSMKVDFFVRGASEFDREEFSRRRLEPLLPGATGKSWIKSPEDSVLRKLLWFRSGAGASDQQWRDVLGLLASQAGRLDEAYLETWSRELELSDLLERARRESTR